MVMVVLCTEERETVMSRAKERENDGGDATMKVVVGGGGVKIVGAGGFDWCVGVGCEEGDMNFRICAPIF